MYRTCFTESGSSKREESSAAVELGDRRRSGCLDVSRPDSSRAHAQMVPAATVLSYLSQPNTGSVGEDQPLTVSTAVAGT